MKKLFSFLTIVLFSTTLFAHDFEVDGIYYNILGGDSVEVTSGLTQYSDSVAIPDKIEYDNTTYRVTSIGDSAFISCSNLTTITIPESVTTIGLYAFKACRNLAAITFSNNIISIGSYAFMYCESLTKVTLPNSITSIGSNAFIGCSNLTDIVWNIKNYKNFHSSTAAPFYNIASKIVSFTFGNEVQNIPAYLCSGMNHLTTISIPASVTTIGEFAFENCSTLTEITIGEGVTAIGNFAFSRCKSVETIAIAANNPLYKSINNCIINKDTKQIVLGCKNSIIPTDDSVTMIGEYAFYGAGITTLDIPNTITAIGKRAFYECSSLTDITIPNSVTIIANATFFGCSNLTEITIPNSVTTVGDQAFSHCTSLNRVTLPNSITSIGSSAFESCFALKKVNYTGTIESWCDISFSTNPLSNGSDFYLNDVKVTDITIPHGKLSVDTWFRGCSSIESVTILSSASSINSYAFEKCSNLTEITIPNSVTKIGTYAFGGCSSLAEINIPDNVTTIGRYAFQSCSSLTEITIGNSVITIGESAFSYCIGLTKITCEAVMPPAIGGDYTFTGVDKTIPLYVPAESVESYKIADYWKEFTNILPIPTTPDVLTSIESTHLYNAEDDIHKVVEKGTVYILRNGEKYTIDGRKIM